MYKIFLSLIIVFSFFVAYPKVCTNFDKNNEIIGEHTAWLHCLASDGPEGTVNSCDCEKPLSLACRKACKKLY